MIGKQVLAFGKREKSELINIGIFAASSGGHKRRCHIGRFTPDRERSRVCLWGWGMVWILTFLFANPECMPSTVGTFHGQSPAQILAGKCEITLVSLGMESKAWTRFHGTTGMMLRSEYGI